MAESSSFFDKPAGKIVAGIVLVAGIGLILWTILTSAAGGAAAAANRRLFVDAATGKSYWVDLDDVSDVPAQVPGGGKTGYPAELCFWTADGKTKDEPTGVLLNETVGKSGPTFCPDCKRLVVGHNPPPADGVPPPPTEAEYRANPRRGGGSGGGDRN
jgi:hypothetical protein